MARAARGSDARGWARAGQVGGSAALVTVIIATAAFLGSLAVRFAPRDEGAPVTPVLTLDRIRVQVQNGCGVVGAARSVASLIQGTAGIDVVEVGNAGSDGLWRSVVIDRGGRAAEARRVAEVLGVEEVLLQRQPELTGVDVTVVVGYDHGRWEPRKRLGGGHQGLDAPEG